MKLRNKQTGEILESAISSAVIKDKFRIYDELNDKYYTYDSLAELNAEWEDYEEPKEYYYYIDDGGIISIDQYLSTMSNMRKSFGNYFETEKEAEKAAERLRAWKRLKDKGFKFDGYHIPAGEIHFNMAIQREAMDEFIKDMGICFGGEE